MPIRHSISTAIGAALLAAATAAAAAAAADEFPKLKAGLWQVNMTSGKPDGRPPRVSTMCLDDSVQREMYRMSTGMASGMCSKHEIKIAGNKVTTIANCDLGVTKMQSQAVMTLTGNTAYHTEARASFDPPLNGAKETNTVIEGKHVGACKPGQKPGDVTLPDGQTINVRQMMGSGS
ncbi:MAG TPA: DUF3617 family protein [Casimicrobiaceae bacterium]|nr:DUF3617 family protein [Casimicrobiaceae bacterium]